MPKPEPVTPHNLIIKVLDREFTKFFTNMLAPEPGFTAPSDEQFIESLANSIVAAGDRSGRGIAVLQTMVHELQERINHKLNPEANPRKTPLMHAPLKRSTKGKGKPL